jgi:hypothetical protein
MYYAYVNNENVAGATKEERVHDLCRAMGIVDYVVKQQAPNVQVDYYEQKNMMLQKVDDWTANKITGGFVSSASGAPVRYDSDKDTQITMQGIALNVDTQLFAEKYPNGCPVRGYAEGETEKNVFWLGAEGVKRWCADLSLHIGECKQAGWAKQAEVNACTTIEQLQSVIFE